MTKILMLCYEYPPIGGGGAKVVDGLTAELDKLGHTVDLITMGFKDLPVVEQRGNLNIFRINSFRLRTSICSWPEMILYIIASFRFLLKLNGKDYYINHTHFIFPDGILAYILKKIKNIPYLITAHGSDVPGYNPDRFIILHTLLKPLWKLIINNAENIIVPSASLDSLIKAVHPRLHTHIIPNGINIDKYSPSVQKEEKILVVTRMFERKGVQHFIRAFSNVNSDFRVNIVGEGPYLEILKKLAVNQSRIKFYGFLDNNSKELSELYETSRIFVFTSESENFPIVLLEAMTAGLAIITSANTGCAEVVGDGGLLVNPKDPDQIGKALRSLITNPSLCTELGHKARQRAEDLFSWKTVARKYIRLYSSHGLNTESVLLEPLKVK